MELNRYQATLAGINISYLQWGDVNSTEPPIVCVHGLTGNARDFHFVGDYFAARGKSVVAIDMPGRGKSDWIEADKYNFDTYITLLNDFLDHLKIDSCIWLGVSMGGLLGIRMAANDKRIKKMILVDVGPEVPQDQLDFISSYLTLAPVFETIDGVVGAMKQSIGTPFYRGPMTESEWQFFAESSMRKLPDGRYTRSFDPGIAQEFKAQPLGHTNMWDEWEKIEIPVLAIRGALSLLFPMAVVEAMQARKNGQRIDLAVIEDAGHVPSLYPDDQIEIISNWLRQ